MADPDWVQTGAKAAAAKAVPPKSKCEWLNRQNISKAVRGLGVVTGCCVTIASFFGFETARKLVEMGTEKIVSSRFGEITAQDVGLFVGVLLIFLMFAGVLIALAELRLGWIRLRLLKPFGFMLTFVGRGLFELFTGFALGVIANYFARAIGGVMAGCGVCTIILGFFMPKEIEFSTLGAPVGKPKDPEAALARSIEWGKEGAQVPKPSHPQNVTTNPASGLGKSTRRLSSEDEAKRALRSDAIGLERSGRAAVVSAKQPKTQPPPDTQVDFEANPFSQ